MSEKELWTLVDVVDKAEWEGGLDELWRWGGTRFETTNVQFNQLWLEYDDLMKQVDQLEAAMGELLGE